MTDQGHSKSESSGEHVPHGAPGHDCTFGGCRSPGAASEEAPPGVRYWDDPQNVTDADRQEAAEVAASLSAEGVKAAREAVTRMESGEFDDAALAEDVRRSEEIEPMDWLLNFVQAVDHTVSTHYWHMVDGQHRTCGCPREGDDDAR